VGDQFKYANDREKDLIERCQKGDEAAFAEIYQRFQGKVTGIIVGILRGPHQRDIEDVHQNVFIKVYRYINAFDFRASLTTWMYRITVNECYDFLRKRKVRSKVIYDSDILIEKLSDRSAEYFRIDLVPDHTRNTHEDLANAELLRLVLGKLSKEDRGLIILKYHRGLSIEELVEITGINENTIKVKLHRICKKIIRKFPKRTPRRIAVTA